MEFERYLSKINGEEREKFSAFKKLLVEKNGEFNLTSVCDDDGVLYKHFLDSAVGEKYFPKNGVVAEIGSGGGFPSIPLKIIRSDLNFTLIESTGKKCGFLRLVKEELKLDGMEILCCRAEEAAKTEAYREKFDAATARAVANLPTLLEYCLPFVKVGGKFIAYKGEADEELAAASNALKVLGGEVERIEKFDLLGFGKRTLIVIKKVKPTPNKYPRGQGKERKQPL